MGPKTSAEELAELTLAQGFDLVGVAPLRPPRGAARFQEWLLAGHHADMDWLENQRDRILDPRRSLPDGKSLLVVGLGYSRGPVEVPGGGRVARYAAGRDYHNLIGKKLQKLARTLTERGIVREWKKVVDAGPLLERSHAAEAGLGFESRSANLLHPRFGPWFLLAELLLDVELEATPQPMPGSCGTCTACLDACPTQALREPGVLDANLCLSYHTIENRGPIPHELRRHLGEWVFGCDVCSEVCPWGHQAPDLARRFGTHAMLERGLTDWLATPESSFDERFAGSPLRRPGRDGLARDAALVLGNRPSDEGQNALEAALEDHSPLVREAAFWSLSQAHGDARTKLALERAWSREEDSTARAGMARTRQET